MRQTELHRRNDLHLMLIASSSCAVHRNVCTAVAQVSRHRRRRGRRVRVIMSHKKHSLATYVQKTLMQFLPSIGAGAAKSTTMAPAAAASMKPKGTGDPTANGCSSAKKKNNSASGSKANAHGPAASKPKSPAVKAEPGDESGSDSGTPKVAKKHHKSSKYVTAEELAELKAAAASKKAKQKDADAKDKSQKKQSAGAQDEKPTKKPSKKVRVKKEDGEEYHPMDTASDDDVDGHTASDEQTEDEDEHLMKSNGKSHKAGHSKHDKPSKSSSSSHKKSRSLSPAHSRSNTPTRSRSRSPSPASSAASSKKAKQERKQLKKEKKRSLKKAAATKKKNDNASSTEDEEPPMSDVDESASAISSPSSAAIAPSLNSPASSKSKKRKHAAASSDADAAADAASDSDAASRRSVTPPLPPTSRLHSNASPLSNDLSSDDDADVEPDRRTPSKVKHIDHVQIGNYELAAWYHSPYPDIYRTAKKLFICQYCLKYCKEYKSLAAHTKECTMRKPPGKLIYEDGKNSVSAWSL
jgi:hypothetical protein